MATDEILPVRFELPFIVSKRYWIDNINFMLQSQKNTQFKHLFKM